MKVVFGVAAIMCVVAAGQPALGRVQDKPAKTKPGTTAGAKDPKVTTPPMNADIVFMRTAAMDGMAEVQHGQLAAQNAASGDVKQFGQRMVDDHSKANAELKNLASQKTVTLPTELDGKHKAMQAKLSTLKGAAFDRAYIAHMVTAHKDAVALFQREAKTGIDTETKTFAEKTLPTLQEHLKMAQDLSAKNKTQ